MLSMVFQVFDFADTYRGSYSDSLNSVVCPFYCSYSGYHVSHLIIYLFTYITWVKQKYTIIF